jgi:serine/threonine protein kinase
MLNEPETGARLDRTTKFFAKRVVLITLNQKSFQKKTLTRIVSSCLYSVYLSFFRFQIICQVLFFSLVIFFFFSCMSSREASLLILQNQVPDHDISEDYDIEEETVVGTGSFSVVKRARCRKTGDKVAVKIIDKTKREVRPDHLRQEVAILKQIDHPNIVSFRNVYETRDKVFFVTELLNGGEVFDRIVGKYPRGFPEPVAARMICKILDALVYLHGKGIIHRDLKPENLLYVSPVNDDDDDDDKVGCCCIKLIDFGLAIVETPSSKIDGKCGSFCYMAPEIVLGDTYNSSVDMWSLGILAYIFLSGNFPFDDTNPRKLLAKIMACKYNPLDFASVAARDFIECLLRVNSSDRYTAEQCREHPWIKSFSTDSSS